MFSSLLKLSEPRQRWHKPGAGRSETDLISYERIPADRTHRINSDALDPARVFPLE